MFKRKLTLILLGYILGIITELYFKKSIALFIIVLFILIIKYVKLRRKWFLSQEQYYKAMIAIKSLKIALNIKILCIFMFSFFIGIIYTKYLNYRYDNLYLGLEKGTFIGIVETSSEQREYYTKYKINIQSINGDSKYKNTDLYLLVNNANEELDYGDLISFNGEYIEAKAQKNYGGFNYKEYLKTIKIYGTVKCTNTKIDIYEKHKVNILSLKMYELSNKIRENVYKLFNEKEADLLIGVLIGDTKGISHEMQENFKNSSLLHILAVSGTHVNYIIISLLYLVNKIKISKKVGRIITIIILILFMFLVGFSASVVRAVIMGITIMLASLFYRKLDIINSISFSALILLLINPFNIINTGFLLSYAGTIGIVSLSKSMNSLFTKETKKNGLASLKRQYINKFIKVIKDILIITISAQIIIIPIILRMFNTVSLTFFISNLVVSPMMSFITIFGFVTIFISFISISISKVLVVPLNITVKFLIFVADFFGNMKISKIYVVTIPMIFVVSYYICVYISNYLIYIKYNAVGADVLGSPFLRISTKKKIYLLKENYKKVLICFILVLIIFTIFSNLTTKFTIHFIDVGQR